MADNLAYTPGSGATVASDEIGGVHYQRIKNAYGADGVATDVSATNPMPVTIDVGTLLQRIEILELLLNRLLSGAGGQMPDSAGRTRVTVDNWAATLTAVGRLNGAGAAGTDVGPAYINMYNLPALMLRNRIVVS